MWVGPQAAIRKPGGRGRRGPRDPATVLVSRLPPARQQGRFHVWGKTPGGATVLLRLHGFAPYLYIAAPQLERYSAAAGEGAAAAAGAEWDAQRLAHVKASRASWPAGWCCWLPAVHPTRACPRLPQLSLPRPAPPPRTQSFLNRSLPVAHRVEAVEAVRRKPLLFYRHGGIAASAQGAAASPRRRCRDAAPRPTPSAAAAPPTWSPPHTTQPRRPDAPDGSPFLKLTLGPSSSVASAVGPVQRALVSPAAKAEARC